MPLFQRIEEIMNLRVIIGLVLTCVLSVAASSTHAAEANRQRLLMDMGWKFNLGDVEGAEKPAINDTAWRDVDLPHDYGIEGKELTVEVYSCCDKVRLYLNDKLLEEKPTTQNEQCTASFTVPFAPGTLKAAGVQGDKEVEEYIIRTAGDAAKIRLTPDRANIQADSQDLSYVTVEVLDKDDRVQPNANNIVKFSISGPGTIAGMDNGDMRDEEPYKGDQHKVFHGRAIVVIRVSNKPGDIKLTASAEGLAPAIVTIQARPVATNAVLP